MIRSPETKRFEPKKTTQASKELTHFLTTNAHEMITRLRGTFAGGPLTLVSLGSVPAGVAREGSDIDVFLFHDTSLGNRDLSAYDDIVYHTNLFENVSIFTIARTYLTELITTNQPLTFMDKLALVSLFVTNAHIATDQDKTFIDTLRKDVVTALVTQGSAGETMWQEATDLYRDRQVLYNEASRRERRTEALTQLHLTQEQWEKERKFTFPTLDHMAKKYHIQKEQQPLIHRLFSGIRRGRIAEK